MEVGDKVRIIANEKTKCKYGWDDKMDEITDGTVRKIDGADIRVDTETGAWWYHRNDLIVSGKPSKVARILTEKVMVNGIKCRKIMGFEGILEKKDLPKKYLESVPNFSAVGVWLHRTFDGTCIRFGPPTKRKDLNGISFNVPDADPKIDMGDCTTMLEEGAIIPEETYQAILTWLRRAGSRLAKIRKQEKESWQGKQEDEI